MNVAAAALKLRCNPWRRESLAWALRALLIYIKVWVHTPL